jgi:heme exporter protein B
MEFIRTALVVFMKDLRAELRTKEAMNASLGFALVMLVLFSFAFDPDVETTVALSGGLLWIIFAFAGALILNRSFARELPNDCLGALIAAPVSGSALFLGKALANFVLVMAMELISLPVFGLFYNVRWASQWPELLLVMALGTWGLTVHTPHDPSSCKDGQELQDAIVPALLKSLLKSRCPVLSTGFVAVDLQPYFLFPGQLL